MTGQSLRCLWWPKWQWDRFFSGVLSFSPVSIIRPVLHTHISFICLQWYIILATVSVVKWNISFSLSQPLLLNSHLIQPLSALSLRVSIVSHSPHFAGGRHAASRSNTYTSRTSATSIYWYALISLFLLHNDSTKNDFFKYNRIIVLFHAKRVLVLFDLFIVLATGIDRFVFSRRFVLFKISNNYVIYTFLLGYVWRSLDSSEEQLLLNINFFESALTCLFGFHDT
jgi:hypothetical protein